MKKTISILLCAAISFCFFGCSKSNDGVTLETIETTGRQFDFDDNYSISVPVYGEVHSAQLSLTYDYDNYVLDSNGLVIQRDVSDNLTGTYTYEYDSNGFVIAENYQATGNYDYYDNYENVLDENGRIVSRVRHSSASNGMFDGTAWEKSYEYDTAGFMVTETSITITSDDGYTSVHTYEYDDRGFAVNSTETSYPDGINSPIGNSYSMTNVYDVYGNLISGHVQKITGDRDSWDFVYDYDCIGYVDFSTDSCEWLSTTDLWTAYNENEIIPKADSCITVFTLIDNSDGQYVYSLSNNQNYAQVYYAAYMCILEDICGFTMIENSDGTVSVKNGSETIAEMTFCYNPSDGYCVAISID